MHTSALTPSKYLAPHEEKRLVEILKRYRRKDLRNTTMLLFMLKTGARPSELLDLIWEDIDLKQRQVFIRTQKGGKSRLIPLNKELMARFKRLGPKAPQEKVFDIGYNRLRDLWVQFRPCEKKLHSLRHTFAVNLYSKSNYNLRLVQLALGHRQMPTTAIYLEIETSRAELRRVME